ncbi:MAG TPA: TetR/AcrR family transcriptional regulator [Solirubrobacteraceae bacterium]|jgi:AcrR family transcriptional regulator
MEDVRVATGASSCRLGIEMHAIDTPTPEQVAADQRSRLCAAMVEIVSETGYHAVTVRGLCALAGVSSATLYKLFPEGKQQCLLHVHDAAVRRTARRVADAYATAGERKRLACAFEVFLQEVAAEPKLARLALVDALGAGTVALERSEHMQRLFEAMVNVGLLAEGRGTPPALVIKGIVAGVARVARVRLLEGRIAELGSLSGPLLDWARGYSSSAPASLLADDNCHALPRRAVRRSRQSAGGGRARVLRAAAQLAVLEGAGALTVAEIAEAAEVPLHSLEEELSDPRRCVLEAFELLTAEALALALVSARSAEDWEAGVYWGMVAFTRHVATDPVFARLAFIEVYALGPAGVEAREKLLGAFAGSLWACAPRQARLEGVAAEASVGAVWGILHHYVLQGEAKVLPRIAGKLTYMLLSPTQGAERAVEAILAERSRGAP